MLSILKNLFVHNWQRKLIALILAIIIWILINNSITESRTFPGVAIRIVNLPPNMTVEGLMPDGLLDKQMTILLTGRKNAVEALSSNDLEIVIDARGKGAQWIVNITKQMLVCTNPDIDLASNITDVSHGEFVIKLTPLVTDKIPVYITKPLGEPPAGYQFLDIWPQMLYQTVSGPQDEIAALKATGFELTFDLSAITSEELDSLADKNDPGQNDEISFPVPRNWKKVYISFLGNDEQEINDPNAALLRIDFLRKELLTIDSPIPIFIYYPLRSSATVNPSNTTLTASEAVASKNGIHLLTTPLLAGNVSRLFLDVVRDNLTLAIIAYPSSDLGELDWSVQFIDPKELENEYVAIAKSDIGDKLKENHPQYSEHYLRARFQNYMRKLELFTGPDRKLQLNIQLRGNQIGVKTTSP